MSYMQLQQLPQLNPGCARCDELREAFRVAIGNLARELFPNSPQDSAMAEFDLDAMGACQVLRRWRECANAAEHQSKLNLEALNKERSDNAALQLRIGELQQEAELRAARKVITALRAALGAGQMTVLTIDLNARLTEYVCNYDSTVDIKCRGRMISGDWHNA